jgi:hypothetical protein
MNSKIGLLGTFVLAIGGVFFFEVLDEIVHQVGAINNLPSIATDFYGFIAFLFIGLGLWLIVLSGKSEIIQNPS